MKTGMYVVTEAIEACGKSMEIVSTQEGMGGVFEDGALALRAILKEEPQFDRFLYSASFEDGELQLDRMIFGLCYDQKINRYRILMEPK
ncbi:MAG: hypothetical protein IJV64_12310 [Oscillospiraceae bacterium]|nr:hypothetical protein [Oscillospiraceae bacterium]